MLNNLGGGKRYRACECILTAKQITRMKARRPWWTVSGGFRIPALEDTPRAKLSAPSEAVKL